MLSGGGGATLQVVVLDGEVGSCAHKKVPLVVEAHELWYGSCWEFHPCSLMASLPGCNDHTSWFSFSVDAFAKDRTLPVVLTHICKHVVWVEITHSVGSQKTELPEPCFLHVEHGGEGLEPLSTCLHARYSQSLHCCPVPYTMFRFAPFSNKLQD